MKRKNRKVKHKKKNNEIKFTKISMKIQQKQFESF